MPDFEKTITIAAAQQQVIDFVSKPVNMPKYLPTCKAAKMEGADHAHMNVEIEGQKHEDTGYLRRTGDNRLEWGSEDHDYHGDMSLNENGRSTKLTLHLHINPPPQLDEKMNQNSGGDWSSKIDESIQSALNAIKTQVEGKQSA